MPTLEFGDRMFRTHGLNMARFFFGCTRRNRFDSPDCSFDVLCAGLDHFRAFIETFARVAGTRVITTQALKQNALTEFKSPRPLRLIDLSLSGALVRIGADGNLFTGNHDVSQLWSRAFHDHPKTFDGVLYPSRLDPVRQAVVLFGDRTPNKMTELSRESWYAPGAQRQKLVEIVEHYELELIESQFFEGRKPAARAAQGSLLEPD
jgi:hypothetical protein